MSQWLPVTVTAMECYENRELYAPGYLLLLPMRGGIRLTGAVPQTIPEGTLLFLSSFLDARVQILANTSLLYAVIDTETLDKTVLIPKRISRILFREGADEAKDKLISLFDLCHNNQEAGYFQKLSACYDLLSTLEPSISAVPEDPSGGQRRDSQVVAYLEENFRESIRLSEVAEHFGVTPQHLSTTLHRELGTTFSEYLQGIRLEEATRLLLTTDKTVTAISEESGFPNLRSFNQAFQKKFGCAPRQFRSQHALNSPGIPASPQGTVLQHINQLLQPYRGIYSKSSEDMVSVSYRIAANQGTDYLPVWQDTLNIDLAASCLQATVQDSIAAIQRKMKFRYVRLTNLFQHELSPYIIATGQHRFTGYFRVINFLRKQGLLPTLVFGSNFELFYHAIMQGDPYNVSLEDWLQQFSSIIEASIFYWGKSWVSQWRFEFYMPETLYGSQDPTRFLDLLEQSVQILRSHLPEAQIGGPAIPLDRQHHAQWRAWFQGIKARNIPLNYISATLWADMELKTDSFSGQFQEPLEVRSLSRITDADTSLPLQKVRALRGMMEEFGVNAKLYISALGVTPYQAAAAQSGGHAGAYLVKSLLELRELVDGIGCWKALNSEVEYDDEFQICGSGCGLYSRNGLKNPNWYAYAFLSGLLPKKLFQGPGCFATGDGMGNYAVLLYNCKNYSQYFLKHYLTEKSLAFGNHKLYQNNAAIQQTLSLEALQNGTYIVRQYLIGNHHGCLAGVLQQMGDIRHLSQGDIAYLAGQSLPFQHTYHVEAQGTLQLTVSLQANEVMLLLISARDSEQNAPST